MTEIAMQVLAAIVAVIVGHQLASWLLAKRYEAKLGQDITEENSDIPLTRDRMESFTHSGQAILLPPGDATPQYEKAMTIISCTQNNPWRIAFFCTIPSTGAIVFFPINREDLEGFVLSDLPLPEDSGMIARKGVGRIEFTPSMQEDTPVELHLGFDLDQFTSTIEYFKREVDAEMESMVDAGLEIMLSEQG